MAGERQRSIGTPYRVSLDTVYPVKGKEREGRKREREREREKRKT